SVADILGRIFLCIDEDRPALLNELAVGIRGQVALLRGLEILLARAFGALLGQLRLVVHLDIGGMQRATNGHGQQAEHQLRVHWLASLCARLAKYSDTAWTSASLIERAI